MSQSTISFQHPLAVCVSRIEAALDEAAGADPMYLSTTAKQEVLLALTRVSTRVDGLRLTVMANAGDVAAETGARSVGSWVAHETRVDPPAAAADAKLAGLLEAKYPRVRAGVLSGRVNLAQARVIVAALDELPARIGAELRAGAETRLVAEAEHFDPRRLRVLGRRISTSSLPRSPRTRSVGGSRRRNGRRGLTPACSSSTSAPGARGS